MKLSFRQGTATVPQTKEALQEQFTQNQSALSIEIEGLLMRIEKMKLGLARMSKDLYGTENFSSKKTQLAKPYWLDNRINVRCRGRNTIKCNEF